MHGQNLYRAERADFFIALACTQKHASHKESVLVHERSCKARTQMQPVGHYSDEMHMLTIVLANSTKLQALGLGRNWVCLWSSPKLHVGAEHPFSQC